MGWLVGWLVIYPMSKSNRLFFIRLFYYCSLLMIHGHRMDLTSGHRPALIDPGCYWRASLNSVRPPAIPFSTLQIDCATNDLHFQCQQNFHAIPLGHSPEVAG